MENFDYLQNNALVEWMKLYEPQSDPDYVGHYGDVIALIQNEFLPRLKNQIAQTTKEV